MMRKVWAAQCEAIKVLLTPVLNIKKRCKVRATFLQPQYIKKT